MMLVFKGGYTIMSKHLSLSERAMIHSMLEQSKSFKEMGRILGRSCSTISKEIRSHLLFQKKGCMGHAFNDCINRYDCTLSHLCSRPDCTRKYCRFCSQCHLHCHYYQKESCEKLEHPPYVCNGCGERNKCTLEKRIYSPVAAQKEYEAVRSESRSGISISEDEAVRLDELFSPLLLKGQSIHHVCTAKAADVMFSERTIYNYVDSGIFTAKNIDLPRKVKYRPRKSRHDSFKVDRTCRIGRTYEDFQQFLSETPDCPVVQLDSVEGRKGGSVLLTIHFVKCEFMLAFIREHNTAASVCDVFEKLYLELRPDVFMKLFPVLLADNGSEFSDPARIETDRQGNQRTRLFYCDPSAPYQKGAIENNHEFIRRILPKGTSFDSLTQQNINLMMNHINSYARKNLGNKSPYETFRYFYGQEVLDALDTEPISSDEIILRPELLK